MDCGGAESELDHYKQHTYKEYEIAFGERLILCDFCDVDFGSYKRDFFGFTNKHSGFEHLQFVRDIHDKSLRKGYFCSSCHMTHSFLKFVAVCREKNTNSWNKWN